MFSFVSFQRAMSVLLLFVHRKKIRQEKLDRRRHIQKHDRQEHPVQSDIHIRRQRMDCSASS